MTITDWTTFVVIWTAVCIPFGASAANCMSTAASYGFKSALWAVAGVSLASFSYMLLSVFGFAALMMSNPLVLSALRWAGVAYLAYLGLSLLLSKRIEPILIRSSSASKLALVAKAFLISAGNPKVLIVWVAVFTQFLDTTLATGKQLLILGSTALAISASTYVLYALLGAGIGQLLSKRRLLVFNRLIGGAYLFFAATLAVFEMRTHSISR